MSKTIEEIKDQYAIEKGFNNWEGFIMEQPVYRYEDHTDEVAKRYAELKSHDITKQKEYYLEILERLDLKNIGIVLGIENNKSVSKNLLPRIKELQEQNAELVDLVERCRDVIYAYNDYRPTATGNEILQAIQDRLTKYNHLKSNTNV